MRIWNTRKRRLTSGFSAQSSGGPKIIDDALKLRLSQDELKELTRHRKIQTIYQCTMEDEHRDMTLERGQQMGFLALTGTIFGGMPVLSAEPAFSLEPFTFASGSVLTGWALPLAFAFAFSFSFSF